MKLHITILWIFGTIYLLTFAEVPLWSTQCVNDIHDYAPPPLDTNHPKDTDTSENPAYINLERMAQPFVLETKEFRFKEFPTAFNPTIVRWQGSLLLAFRIRDPITSSTDGIGMVWLDDNFEPIGEPAVLDVPSYDSPLPSKQQDPRLIPIGDDLIMVYNNVIKGIIRKEIRRVMITKVHFEDGKFFTDPPEMILSFDGEKEQRDEKNWTPFDYNGELHLVYSITPHRIEKYLQGCGASTTVATTTSRFIWPWGALRGGTQAYLIGDRYFSFFHSSMNMATAHSKGKTIQHYFMGAYTFSSTPPFEIMEMSPEPIIGEGFYSGPEYKTWKPLRVVFPDGYVFDDQYMWVVYGRQDNEIWLAKIDKQMLLDSLVPVN